MMAVDPLPSVVIATILLADRLSAGGFTLMKKAAVTMFVTFFASWLTQGMAVDMIVSQRTMFATLPLITIYLIALSVLTDSIALRLRVKSRELERIAMMDPLLDIANRRLLEKRIDHDKQISTSELVRSVLSVSEHWEHDLTQVNGLVEHVTLDLDAILHQGMAMCVGSSQLSGICIASTPFKWSKETRCGRRS
jgi:Mannitol-1-phosphate/altronate dehydrogenases